MNNRRLYVIKQLADGGALPGGKVSCRPSICRACFVFIFRLIFPYQVPVRIKLASEVRAADRFTAERCAFTAKFMTESTLKKGESAEEAQSPGTEEQEQNDEQGIPPPTSPVPTSELQGNDTH